MSNVREQMEDSDPPTPEVHPMSKAHKHLAHPPMPPVDKLTVDRIDRCEISRVDPNSELCHTPATHIVHELGVVLCYGHVAAAEAIHDEQVLAPRRKAEAERLAFEKAQKLKADEEKRKEEEAARAFGAARIPQATGSISAPGSTTSN